MVRNAWGDCITKQECKSCKCFWYKDFNVCGRDCPLKCGEPIRTTCSQNCAFGCDCPPGLIRTSSKTYCVKTSQCTPICPANSRYTSCLSECAPKCGQRQQPNCVTRCRRGGCACLEGYAEADHGGVLICVPQHECSKYAPMATPSPPAETGGVGGSGGPLVTPGSTGGGTLPTVPVPPPAAPVPPPGADGSFPSGRPHETTGHGTGGGIAAMPQGPPTQGTPVSPPGGHGGTTPGLAFPPNPPGTPSQVTTTHQTGGGTFAPIPPSQVTQYQPPSRVATPTVIISNYGYGRPCAPCRTVTYTNSYGQPCRPCNRAR
uniref:Putative bitil peptide n=1 Tax=Rhipicephalus pulchellus TaxID=72859 RepID=L7LQD4_RHIPC